jgi:hypothetical protein
VRAIIINRRIISSCIIMGRGHLSDHRRRANGRTFQAIADGLTADGIHTARG